MRGSAAKIVGREEYRGYMTDPNAQRVWACAFCGRSEVQRSKEHVLRRWFEGRIETVADYVTDIEFFEGAADDAVSRTVRPIPKSAFDMPINEVCRECNQGWLNDLESSIEEELVELANGRFVQLTPEIQTRLRTWLFKTALMFTLTNRQTPRLTGLMTYLFEHRAAPPLVGAQFAVCDELAPNAAGRHHALASSGRLDEDGNYPMTHVVAFGLGRMFFMVSLPSRSGKPAKMGLDGLRLVRSATPGKWRFLEPRPRHTFGPPRLITRDIAL